MDVSKICSYLPAQQKNLSFWFCLLVLRVRCALLSSASFLAMVTQTSLPPSCQGRCRGLSLADLYSTYHKCLLSAAESELGAIRAMLASSSQQLNISLGSLKALSGILRYLQTPSTVKGSTCHCKLSQYHGTMVHALPTTTTPPSPCLPLHLLPQIPTHPILCMQLES